MGGQRPAISDGEMEVMKLLWKLGPSTVRDVWEKLQTPRRNLAYTTVQTLMTRLRDKGYVTSKPEGVAHVFRAKLSRQRLLKSRLNDLANQLCDGMSKPLVQALVEAKGLSNEDIAQLRELLDQLEEGSGK